MNGFNPDTSIEYLKGVGPKRGELLRQEINVFTFGDLLEYFPFRYIDRSVFHQIKDITPGQSFVQLRGKIIDVKTTGQYRSSRLHAIFQDETGTIELVWFQGIKWLKEKVVPNQFYVVYGKPSLFKNSLNVPHPEIEKLESLEQTKSWKGLYPVYSSTEKLKAKGLHSRGISKLIHTLFINHKPSLEENLSQKVIKSLNLISRNRAIRNIHYPENREMLNQARNRLKFEEFYFIQLQLMLMKHIRKDKLTGHKCSIVGENFNEFYKNNLPFELTSAQKKVIKEVRRDLGAGKQMNRLLQGDVGSGKTLVALMSMLIAIDNGFQTCLMAPTEILAQQHYKTLRKMLSGMALNVDLLTGSTKTKSRKLIHEHLLLGNLNILVGTHALIEENVKFKNLGLVVIDEQHRFGVAQRAKLWKKNTIPPHILVMTATPIPRTLAMTVYGDLDVSVINELPPGRKPIKTFHLFDKDRLKLFGFMKKVIQKGSRIYVVYPVIHESEKLDLKDLHDGYESITREFPLPDYAVSIVHGKMKPADKEIEMQRFIKGQTQIMVATTVIEVGVDVPEASVMVIENAERFGLSQLHQLRGRVGRGMDQSFCILMTKKKLSNDARKRIDTLVKSSDGFKIAEADMKLRGPGDMHGTRQSGILDLKIADIIEDERILKVARKKASETITGDPGLTKAENLPVRKFLSNSKDNRINWSLIS